MIELDLQISLDQSVAPESHRSDLPRPSLPDVNLRARQWPARQWPARSIPVRGWYLPSTDLAEWIEVLNDCCQKSDYRLYLAPTSASDVRASGLILLASCTTLPAENRAIKVPLGAIGLIGLGSLSNQVEVWLPYNARLEPAISLSQLVAKLEDSESRTYVWLPSVGLIAFEPMDALEATQFLRRPSINDNNSNRQWSALPVVEQLPDRIADFIFPPPKPFEQIFGQEQNEIGSESNQLSTIDDQGNAGGQGILGKIQLFISDHIERWIKKRDQQHSGQEGESANPQGGATGKSLIDRLVSRIAKVNQSERDKQINKLLNLMQTDPDKALRFAIPLAAMSAFRGIGHRSNRLTETTPDFSLPKLFGSGPVDPWAFSQKVQAQLQAAYRMQAERELAAGRFRRAAYIHAHLLGDFTAAATILERGKAFREAAVIYGEKLNRPRDQARCFALAGVADQAAQIYEELGDYEAAAKTWEEFADFERARLAYRKAVDLKIERFDFLAAANCWMKNWRIVQQLKNCSGLNGPIVKNR